MPERTLSRRDALRTIFIGTPLALLACKDRLEQGQDTSKNTGDFIDFNDPSVQLSYANTFLLPLMSTENPINDSRLDPRQNASLDKVGIKEISFKSLEQKTEIKIDFNPDVYLGSPFSPKSNSTVPYGAFAVVWASLPDGRKIGNFQSAGNFALNYNPSTDLVESILFEFDFTFSPEKTCVIILNSRLLKVNGEETPPFTIPFQFQVQGPDHKFQTPTSKT